jgi:hypothetical protein
MAQNQISTGFSMYTPRRLERLSFGSFSGCSIDQFTDPVAQNPNNFLNIQNLLPTVGGSFQRRWGTSLQAAGASGREYVRMFPYTVAADTTFTGSQDSRSILATDNTNVDVLWSEVGTPAFGMSAFSGTGTVYGATSRDWFYAMDGVGTPKKVDYSQTTINTLSNWGIQPPTSGNGVIPWPGSVISPVIHYLGVSNSQPVNQLGVSGTGYTSVPTVVFSGGGGSGAVASATIFAGGISGVFLSNFGTGYTTPPTITFTGGGGSGATFTAVIDSDSTSSTYQMVTGVIMVGPMTLNAGRTYGLALQNSITGHTSDYIYAQYACGYAPIFTTGVSFPAVNTGCTSVNPTFTFDILTTPGIDPQVDTVLLLATSDGGDVEHMYNLTSVPLSSWTTSTVGSFTRYTMAYQDTLPDTYNDTNQTGLTLLTQNLWVDVDAFGNPIGIAGNTPPLSTLNKPIPHQGRMFATDGKSVYFSKSIDEVTTSTGLITSKWEEAWPGTNVLDIAYDDEEIVGLLSDGTYLYIGTTDTIYRLVGSSSQNFSIPAAVFRGVGVLSQDAWSVIYKDNIPAGYMWVTLDGKVMLSDFNTYQEIGKPINPLLAPGVNTVPTSIQIQSMSFGPYSLVFLSYPSANGFSFFVYDTKNLGWYQWYRDQSSDGITNLAPNTAMPVLSYTLQNGLQQLYFINPVLTGTPPSTTPVPSLVFFDPNTFQDSSLAGGITNQAYPYLLETSWINLMDTASAVVLNELEVWGDVDMNVALYRANTPADFAAPVLVRSGPLVQSAFNSYKLYLAGATSFGRYHKAQFFTNTTVGLSNSTNPIEQYQFEFFPHTRA